jgi:hypothetical protein
MDVNRYIIDNTDGGRKPLNQIQFKMVLGLDKDNMHIPKWFKDKRVIALIDYCVSEFIIDKNRVFYEFSHRYDPFDIKFISFIIYELTLEQLTELSNILPAPDLKEYIKFKPSEPYHTPVFSVTKAPKDYLEIKKSKATTFYNLNCTLDVIETKIGTVLRNY